MTDRWRRYPTVYEINTRVWLAELGRLRGTHVDLGRIPEDEIDRLDAYGPDGVWMMGVWAPSPASREIALQHSGPGSELRTALPDLRQDDVLASPFAVQEYRVSQALGGEEGLRRFRQQLSRRSIRLMLDFVPNHLAVDHPWTASHPDYLVQCDDTEHSPAGASDQDDGCFTRDIDGKRIHFAHGRDPYFPPWTDTVQVDYSNGEARSAMLDTLQNIAEQCDGVRCDMAMLVMNDVFRRVWGRAERRADAPAGKFWEEAIAAVKSRHPNFVFLGEVYWGLDRALQRQGFDYTYDKGLYDILRSRDTGAVQSYLQKDDGVPCHAARFIENHDEQRAVEAFGETKSRAVALVVATLPGMRLFHQGQFQGRSIRLPVQLGRLPHEAIDPDLERFYRQLMPSVAQRLFHEGEWTLLEPRSAWTGNGSYRDIVAYAWHLPDGQRALIAANLGKHRAQALVPLSWPGLGERSWRLHELLHEAPSRPTTYLRDGSALQSNGLFVELDPCQFHFLSIQADDND
jgi:hypothetical protein